MSELEFPGTLPLMVMRSSWENLAAVENGNHHDEVDTVTAFSSVGAT
jgi:hypothetical protein